jgi:hypothetical protein
MRTFCPTRLCRILGVVILVLSGCGGGEGTLYPVSGKVTLDGAPLPDAQLSFVADTTKGSKALATPFGKVKDGTYSLTTNEKPGAPAGSYKVMVNTQYPGGPEKPVVLPARYADPGHSDLSVEVVPNSAPGAYDLKLTSR